MQLNWAELIRMVASPEGLLILSVLILVFGAVFGYVSWRYMRRWLYEMGVDDAVEGTPFERTARRLGTSTVGLISNLLALFIYVGAIVIAFNVSTVFRSELFWSQLTGYFPSLFVATFAVIFGLIAGDKAKLMVSERLRSVKVPEIGVLPELVKYSVFFLAVLVALDQLGVAIEALLILLGAYAFGIVFLAGLAFKQLLAAGAAGLYLVLTQPYSIGDEVEIDERRGIVQEVGMLVTHVESDGEEYVIPNQRVFESGIVRVRE